jgi:hypothetical protein
MASAATVIGRRGVTSPIVVIKHEMFSLISDHV